MKCDKCGEKTHIIFITRNHRKLCDKCYDERKKEKK